MSNPNALERRRQERFSTQESEILTTEIQARTVAIYGSQSIPSRLPEVRKAWEEDALNVRMACQCRKRFNIVSKYNLYILGYRPT